MVELVYTADLKSAVHKEHTGSSPVGATKKDWGIIMYRPLPKQVQIKKSLIEGDGLFAKEDILKGTTLGISHVAHNLFPDGWIRTPLAGFYNHSITPNCELIVGTLDNITHYGKFLTATRLLKTIANIKKGEELTCTYTLWKKEDMTQLTSISKETWLGL